MIDSDSEAISSDSDESSDVEAGPICGNNKKLFEMLYGSSKYMLAEFLLDITKLFKTYKMSKNCIVAVLKLFRKHLPKGNLVPKSKKSFMNIIDEITPHIKSVTKYYCVECGSFVGNTSPKKCNQLTCKSTHFSVSLENNVEDTLRYFFENRKLYEKIDEYTENKTESVDIIRDVDDAQNCKIAAKNSPYDLRLVHNTDGFPMGNSTTMQIWPNFLAIVDIHHKLRPSYLILSNIYCGPCKPNFDYFLENWANQLTKIGTEGFEWLNPKTDQIELSKAYVTVCSVDAQARAPLQNIAYYNGAYGCTFCEIKSEPLKEKPEDDGTENIKDNMAPSICYYPYNLSLSAPLRTKQSIMKHAADMIDPEKESQREKNVKHIKGVKGFSCLAFLPKFDVAGGFSPDFLHSCLLGVVRRNLNHFFVSKYKDKDFYLTSGMKNVISSRLLKIKPPNIVTRLPRSLKYLKQWKGSEFLWWLLFYSLPCLDKTFSNSKYLEHYMLLVRAIHLLLDDTISNDDIEYSKTLLNRFCSAYAELYDPQEETFNLHMLLHYGDSVKKCGPLWASSTMMFEGANNFLKNSIHGSNNVAKELENTAKIYSAIDTLQLMCDSKKIESISCNSMLGFKKTLEILPIEIRDFITALPFYANSDEICVYDRAKINGIIYTTALYKKPKKTCSFYALVDNTYHGEKKIDYVKIMAFLSSTRGSIFVGKVVKAFCPSYKSEQFGVEVKHIKLSLDTHTLVSSRTENILKPLFKIEDKICIPPKIWCTNF